MLLNSSTRATKLQYSQHEYWVEVALRVDENGTCTRREWHFGWAKVALAHQKTTFLWFSRRTARVKMRCLLCFFLQNGCSGRGCLNNICIASYGVGTKFFTTNLMSVDLPLNTPKTRKPIAERTSHRGHGYTHQGVQQSLLHQTTTTPPTECTERTEPSGREKTPTDGTDEHRLGGYGIPAISTLPNSVFCWRTAHSKHLCKSVPSVGEKIFPQNARNAQKLLAEKRLPRIARMNTD